MRDDVYPSNYFGPLGIVHCIDCGAEMSIEDDIMEETTDGYVCLECWLERDEGD